jgi:hypothetical protein
MSHNTQGPENSLPRLTCSPKTDSPSFSVQHEQTAASLVSYNAWYILIEEAPD